jgi:hypothetical protein
MKTETFTIMNKVYGYPCKLLILYMDPYKSTEWLAVPEKTYHAANLGSIGTLARGKLEILRPIML